MIDEEAAANSTHWWWKYSNRNYWLIESAYGITPTQSWAAGAVKYEKWIKDWLDNAGITSEICGEFICIGGTTGEWVNARVLHYRGFPTSYEPFILTRAKFAHFTNTRKNNGAEIGRDDMHRVIARIDRIYIAWDAPAFVSLVAAQNDEYIFEVSCFGHRTRVRVVTNPCVTITSV